MHHPEERDQRLGGQGEQDGSRAASCKQKAEVWVRAESGRTRGREQREIGKRGEGAGREEMAPDHCHSHPHSRWPYLTRGSTHHLWQQGLMAGALISRTLNSHVGALPCLSVGYISRSWMEPVPWLWRAGRGRTFSCVFSKNICSSEPLLISEKLKGRIVPPG